MRATEYSVPIDLDAHIDAVFYVTGLPPRITQGNRRPTEHTSQFSLEGKSVTPIVLNSMYNVSWPPAITNIGSLGVFASFGQGYVPSDIGKSIQLISLPSS